jgi:hypothetical protein
VTTTKVKPLASGSYTAVTLDTHGRALTSDATLTALPPGNLLQSLQAVNEWHNTAGAGNAGLRAQATANASGILLQDS